MASTRLGSIEEVELVWRSFYQHSTLRPRWIHEADFRARLNDSFEWIILQITATVAGERVKEIKYPMDWREAFKERWFPKWALKRWPVRYHEWNVDMLYPQFDSRKQSVPVIALYSNANPASPGFLMPYKEIEDEDDGG